MVLPTSVEFVALCRWQVSLLSKILGASGVAVYLAEDWGGSDRQLTPVIVYPDPPLERLNLPALPSSPTAALVPTGLPPTPNQQQMVLPLVYEHEMLGLLVVSREDHPWGDWERLQAEGVAHTLAIVRVLDCRCQVQELVQAQQRNTLDALLHQLRSPLTAVRTFGKLLLKRLLPSDPNHSPVASILRETNRLQELLQQVDQVLHQEEYLSLESAPPALLPSGPPESCHIPAILSPLIDSAQVVAQERQQELTWEAPAPLPPVRANPTALREVLSNILDNALKYTPPGGKILVELMDETPHVILEVSDTGPGIPAAEQARIFLPHYRGTQVRDSTPGSGLGLAIAQELVHHWGGEIRVFSPGRLSQLQSSGLPGTTVQVSLQNHA